MRFLLFGDGLWAAKSLEMLTERGHSVAGVVLRRRATDGSLEKAAISAGAPVRSPDKVNDAGFVDWVRSLGPDLNISVSYDQILRRPIIDSAPFGFINAHGGKLPHYRGRNVINWALINNEREIGITVHYVDEGIDTGDILLQRVLPIAWEDTYGSLLAKVQGSLPKLVADAVALIENSSGPAPRQPQSQGTYFGGRIPGDEWIDWNDTSLDVYNKIRAITHPGPGARSTAGDRELIIWTARYDVSWPKYLATPGEVVGIVPGQGIQVKTGDSIVLVESIQFEGDGQTEQIPAFRIGTRLGVNLLESYRELRSEVAELRVLVGQAQQPQTIEPDRGA